MQGAKTSASDNINASDQYRAIIMKNPYKTRYSVLFYLKEKEISAIHFTHNI